jgi:hypothetical protein
VESAGTITVQLTPLPGGGSLIIADGTGFVPGLEGRLHPILDSDGRSYIHAANIAVNGGQAQPVPFKVGEPFRAYDSSGHEFSLTVLAMGGTSFLIDYLLIH